MQDPGKIKSDWLAITIFHFLVVMVIFITLDLDRPRRGLIQVTDMYEMVLDIRHFFNGMDYSSSPRDAERPLSMIT